jgi:anti-sigma factor RsiW
MSADRDMRETDLHAYLDGALDPDRAEAVEAALRTDSALTAHLAAYRADKDLLKKVYGPLADRPVPEHLLALAQGRPARRATPWRRLAVLAATVMIAVGAAIGTALWRGQGPSGEIVEAAIAARQNAGEQSFTVSDSRPRPAYDRAISTAVSMQVKVPSLAKMGYRLAAIRLYPHAAGGSAAELLYRDKQDRLFTLYLRRSDGAARFDQFERAGLRVCIWQDDQLGMVMAGNVSTAAMQRLASLAYTGLTL